MFQNIKSQVGSINKRNIYLALGVLLLVFVVSRVIVAVTSKSSKGKTVTQVDESKTTAFVEINKSFEFKAIDAAKKEVPVTFTIVSAERKNDIKVKGENRRPVTGKDYLLIRVEIQNSMTQRVAIASADRIRFEGERGKLYSPDYHNGNVVVDPISTKKDILAFAVDSKQKTFIFQVGELDGEKQKIEVKF